MELFRCWKLCVFTCAVGLGASGVRSAVENLDDQSMETNIPVCVRHMSVSTICFGVG